MGWIIDLYRSPLIKKAVMAVSGLALFGFVLFHMLGNLKLYQGAEKLNSYAEGLREFGAPFLAHGQFLWIARSGLLVMVVLHIWSAWQLTLVNRRARPAGYAREQHQKSTYASRTMRWGGVIIAFFVVYHLLHLTTGTVHSDFVPGDVFHNVVVGFSHPLVSAFYILANVALGLHLYHGLWSLFQSLGISGPRFDRIRQQAALAFAVVISAANISFPLAVLTGVVDLGGGA